MWTATTLLEKFSLFFFIEENLMSGQRYTPEFKDEAVKLITECRYSVPDVAELLGVSQYSTYKWLKAVQPLSNNSDKHVLLEAKKEILRLKSQLKQTEEERDILK